MVGTLCTTAEAGAGAGSGEVELEVLALEVWGVGSSPEALAARNARRDHQEAQAARERKVDRLAFVDAQTGRLDSVTANMMAGGEWGARNAADLSKQALSAQHR